MKDNLSQGIESDKLTGEGGNDILNRIS
jgi:hypothetical protein